MKKNEILYCKYCHTFFQTDYFNKPTQKYTCGKEECSKKHKSFMRSKWQKEHKEHVAKKASNWRKSNPEKWKETIKKYQNKPETRKKLKEYREEYYNKHRDKHNKSVQKWRKSENGKIYESNRRNKKWIQIFPNIFPKDIQIDFHHLDGKIFVLPLPRKIHRHFNSGKFIDKHIEECNHWIEFYYGMHPNDFLGKSDVEP